jgi:hypothetical protein
VQTREVILTAAVILVPLVIAVVVTLWSLEQARYRPRKRRPPGIRQDESVARPAEPGAGRTEVDGESSG